MFAAAIFFAGCTDCNRIETAGSEIIYVNDLPNCRGKNQIDIGTMVFSLKLEELNNEEIIIVLQIENTSTDIASVMIPATFLPNVRLYYPGRIEWIIPWDEIGMPDPLVRFVDINGGETIKQSIKVPSRLEQYKGKPGIYKFYLKLDKRYFPKIHNDCGENDLVLCLVFKSE